MEDDKELVLAPTLGCMSRQGREASERPHAGSTQAAIQEPMMFR
jgi:hypothetical protein